MSINFLDELRWRGLLHQCTDEQGLTSHLADPGAGRRRAYAGFDPTANSLTIGNLVPIMCLVHFARAGHEPIVVMGGGTGLIGDPSGKTAERTLMTAETVAGNVASQRRIFEAVFRGAGLAVPTIVNNAEWLCKLSYLDALRDIGKYFSVNMMIQKESVKARLENREHGISYTEFSYMILQAYDFAHLFRDRAVTVQLGGSDQWGNIVAGTDLIRKERYAQFGELSATFPSDVLQFALRAGQAELAGIARGWASGHFLDDEGCLANATRARELIAESGDEELSQRWKRIEEAEKLRTKHCFGLTNPLVTKADGGKFGKTESGAIWLTAERTSPYAYYQFWLNAADADVIKFLKLFTLLSREEVLALEAAHAANPGAREAHRALAHHATALLHGEHEAANAANAATALFSGEVAALPKALLQEVLAEVPSSDHARASLDAEGVALVELLVETGLAKSKRESREFLANGSVSVNGRKVGPDDRLTGADLLHAELIALRRGKKAWHLTRWA
jgi:tyrosyl-tRNA synthetase